MRRKRSTRRGRESAFWRAKLTACRCGNSRSAPRLSRKVRGTTCSLTFTSQKCQFHAAVATEHEACHRDIAELKQQLKVARGELDQAQEKLVESEAPNQRLQEDISFTKKQIPILRENLEHQKGLINQMQIAQSEVPLV